MARLKDVKIAPPKVVEVKPLEGKRGALKETIAPVGVLPQDWQTAAPRSLFTPRGMPVGHTPDIDRVIALERREPLDLNSPRARALQHMMTERYSNGVPRDGGCDCRRIDPQRFKDNGPGCITELLPIQAYVLYEIGIARGLLANIAVGAGKTVCNLLALLALLVNKGLLLIPASLVEQIWDDYCLLSQHFNVPSMQIWPNGKSKVIAGQPVLHVISYQQLSREKNSDWISNLQPQAIIADEVDKLSDVNSATCKRVIRYFGEQENTLFCGWTGSLTDKSLVEYWHLMALALKENSPMPLDPEGAEDWGRALDAVPNPAPPGALLKLCTRKGQHVRKAFQERLDWTRGVILAETDDIKVQGKDQILELVIRERPIKVIPPIILEALKKVRNGQRPDTLAPDGKSIDDEELLDAMSIAKCAHEVASGMFYRWVFPRGEPKSLILEWFAKRKAYHCEVRERLLRSEEFLDSPFLCEQAAMRFHGDAPARDDRPNWPSIHWPNWRDIQDKVKPKQEAVRLHPFLVEDAANWALTHRGIVWYTMVEFAVWLNELTGLTVHGGGTGAGKRLKMEKGDRSIICSINSHGRGRNGLQFLYNEQLWAQVLSSSKMTEQLSGRIHRRGQRADQVITEIYTHTSELRKSVDQAMRRAGYVQDTIKATQKILKATWETSSVGWDD